MWCDIIGYVAAVKPPLSRMCCVHASGWLCKQLGQDKISPADAAASIYLHILDYSGSGSGLAATDRCHLELASLVSDETVWPCMLRSIIFFKKKSTGGFDHIDLQFVLCWGFLRSISSSWGIKGAGPSKGTLYSSSITSNGERNLENQYFTIEARTGRRVLLNCRGEAN